MKKIINTNYDIINSSRKKVLRKKKGNKLMSNILFLVGIFLVMSVFLNVSLGKDEHPTKQIEVASGTTLWNIASHICNRNPDLNVQNVVYEIKQLNHLTESTIYDGQTLIVYEY